MNTTDSRYNNLNIQWHEAVEARNAHDARVRRILSGIPASYVAGRQQVRRSEGARRAHLTRRIVRIEKAIDALA